MSYPGVLGVHDLMVHDYGSGHQFASLHVEFPAEADPLAAHDVIDNIERDFLKKDNLQVTIHYDPIVTSDAAVGCHPADGAPPPVGPQSTICASGGKTFPGSAMADQQDPKYSCIIKLPAPQNKDRSRVPPNHKCHRPAPSAPWAPSPATRRC